MTSAAWLWLAAALVLLPGPQRLGVVAGGGGTGSVPLALDLAAAALRAGQSVAAACALGSAVMPPPQRAELERVVELLRAGAEPVEAWLEVDAASPLAVVARVAGRSIVSGARLAGALEHAARELRRESVAVAQARAHRVGVLVAAPLAMCFLPSFVCIGIVPAIVGLAGPALHAAP